MQQLVAPPLPNRNVSAVSVEFIERPWYGRPRTYATIHIDGEQDKADFLMRLSPRGLTGDIITASAGTSSKFLLSLLNRPAHIYLLTPITSTFVTILRKTIMSTPCRTFSRLAERQSLDADENSNVFPAPNVSSSPALGSAFKRRGKGKHACDHCRLEHVKCDAARPSCAACENTESRCSFRDEEAQPVG
jgi:hypothetical protein